MHIGLLFKKEYLKKFDFFQLKDVDFGSFRYHLGHNQY